MGSVLPASRAQVRELEEKLAGGAAADKENRPSLPLFPTEGAAPVPMDEARARPRVREKRPLELCSVGTRALV